MKVEFHDHFLGEVASGKYHGKLPFPVEVATGFKRRLTQIKAAKSTQDLRKIGSLHFEKLKGKRYEDRYSIRINSGYRIIFRIDNDGGVEVIGIEEISNHYS